MWLVASAAAAVFTLLSLLHVYWAVGGRAASAAVVPERSGAPLFRPGRLATLAVAGALACAAAIVLGRTLRWSTPLGAWPFTVGTWTLAAVFALRAMGDFRYVGFFKHAQGTRFARNDTRYYSPLCLALAAACALVAAGG